MPFEILKAKPLQNIEAVQRFEDFSEAYAFYKANRSKIECDAPDYLSRNKIAF